MFTIIAMNFVQEQLKIFIFEASNWSSLWAQQAKKQDFWLILKKVRRNWMNSSFFSQKLMLAIFLIHEAYT